jgi:hypothetical protein
VHSSNPIKELLLTDKHSYVVEIMAAKSFIEMYNIRATQKLVPHIMDRVKYGSHATVHLFLLRNERL